MYLNRCSELLAIHGAGRKRVIEMGIQEMFAKIYDRRQPILGVILLGAALTFLFMDFPGDWKYLHMAIFVSSFATGLLLVWGVIGTHPSAARSRRNPGRVQPEQTASCEPIKAQVFRYGASPWRRGAAVAVGVILGLGMIALGVFVGAAIQTPSGWVGPIFGAGCAVWGLILCDYARRYLQVGIHVDEEGIKARLYYRSTDIRWDEVVSLIKQTCTAPMALAGMPVVLNAGTLYLVYSKDAKIWFSNGLVGGDLLAEIIAKRTGMSWEGE